MTPALRDFRASAHYAAIEACLNLGPRGLRNSGATSGATHFDEEEEEEPERRRGGGEEEEKYCEEGGGEEEQEEEAEEQEEEVRPWRGLSSHVTE